MKNKILRIIAVVILMCLLFWAGMRCERELAQIETIGKPVYNVESVYFPDINEDIFLKSKNWGLTGDHKISVISTNSEYEFQPDSTKEFIFHGFGGLLYELRNDTLFVYSSQNPKPPKYFDSKVSIEVIQISNPEWVKMNSKIKTGIQKFE